MSKPRKASKSSGGGGVSDSTNLNSPPCEISVPGSFVVLQGIPGDGVLNTIDSGDLMMGILARQQDNDEYDDEDEDDDDDDDDDDDEYRYDVDDDDNDDYQHVLDADDDMQQVRKSTKTQPSEQNQTAKAANPNVFGGLESHTLPQLHPHHHLPKSSSQSVPLYNSMANNYGPQSPQPRKTEQAVIRAPTVPLSPTTKSNKRTKSGTMGDATSPNPEDSFVVVQSSDRSETNPLLPSQHSQQQQRQQQQLLQQQAKETESCIKDWNKECLLQTKQKREAWKLSTKEAAATSQTSTSYGHPASPDAADTTAVAALSSDRSTLHTTSDLWWIKDGKLRVFSELPNATTRENCRNRRRHSNQALVTLSPGMTFVATRLYVLDTVTLSVLHPNDTKNSNMNSANPCYFSSAGMVGITQVLQIQPQNDSGSSVGGYVISSVDGYAYIVPGLPTNYIDPDTWVWRVTCSVGAYVREGLDLGTRHIATLPYGSFVHVKRKVVNSMGLSRLRIMAKVLLVEDANKNSKHKHKNKRHSRQQQNQRTYSYTIVEGWCSEFLNPLSGQRGNVIQPIPLPLPAIYRIILKDGAVVRSGIELSSPQMHLKLEPDKKVSVTRRIYSEHPQDQCIERLQLGPGLGDDNNNVISNDQPDDNYSSDLCGTVGGWISVRLNKPSPHDELVVELVGVDERFNPLDPGKFHVFCSRQIQSQERDSAPATATGNVNLGNSHDLSSIDTGSPSASGGSSMESSSHNQKQKQQQKQKKKQKQRAAKQLQQGRGGQHQQQQGEKCLICLTEERNATIVHGETGHIACCLVCARILRARGDKCPVCRIPIDSVIQHFWV